MFKILFLISFLIGTQVSAESLYRFDIYGSSTYRSWNRSSSFNPDNLVLESPTWAHTLELRPDLQLGLSEKHLVILRSRHFLQSFQTDFTNPDRTRSRGEGDTDLSDLFFSSAWTGYFSTTIGLQNYQWGPAEIFSPSNPFFHFLNDQRSFFFKEKGRALVRANWNPDPESNRWSVVGLYEPVDNQTRYWTADKEFKPRSALKVEYQFENPANAFAFVGGQTEDQRGYIGEYFTWSPTEGTSLYADLQHRAGRTNYVPERNGLGLYDLVKDDTDRVYTLAVVGLRWEGRVDLRQEFIINEAGFDKDEWNQARSSALTLSPNILKNSRRFARVGLEFQTQAYSYTSLRIPDLGASKMASVSVRWLSSLQHHAGALQLNYEYNLNDHAVLSVEAIEFTGSPNGEFRIVDNRQASIGFRWSY